MEASTKFLKYLFRSNGMEYQSRIELDDDTHVAFGKEKCGYHIAIGRWCDCWRDECVSDSFDVIKKLNPEPISGFNPEFNKEKVENFVLKLEETLRREFFTNVELLHLLAKSYNNNFSEREDLSTERVIVYDMYIDHKSKQYLIFVKPKGFNHGVIRGVGNAVARIKSFNSNTIMIKI